MWFPSGIGATTWYEARVGPPASRQTLKRPGCFLLLLQLSVAANPRGAPLSARFALTQKHSTPTRNGHAILRSTTCNGSKAHAPTRICVETIMVQIGSDPLLSVKKNRGGLGNRFSRYWLMATLTGVAHPVNDLSHIRVLIYSDCGIAFFYFASPPPSGRARTSPLSRRRSSLPPLPPPVVGNLSWADIR